MLSYPYYDRSGIIGDLDAMADFDPEIQILSAHEAAFGRAVELWSATTTRPEAWDRDSKLLEKQSVVKRFFTFIGKHAGEITPSDVERWRKHLEEQGHKPATVYARISRVSSFYKWLLLNPKLAVHIGSNPVQNARPRYPRPYQSDSVSAWSNEEANAILGVVRRLASEGSIVGKRDYALLLFYLYTGLRRNEVIRLRGRDLERRGETLIIKYQRKGGKFAAREVSEPEVYEALADYLEASGRIAVLRSSAAIWTRHDRAGKAIPQLGSRTFANNLKKYAKAAGIEHVHVHQTRHTYARMVAEDSGSFSETQEALDHENLATTKVYVQRITVKRDRHSGGIAKRLKEGRTG
ncbi:MAG TPA: site-specific integrase [Blastocatellia bacterium]|nr:site-specific integrase [Blastocatellia bacterium]